MRQELLSHTLTLKVAPSLHAELIEASERKAVSTSELVRRAIRGELAGTLLAAKAASPRAPNLSQAEQAAWLPQRSTI